MQLVQPRRVHYYIVSNAGMTRGIFRTRRRKEAPMLSGQIGARLALLGCLTLYATAAPAQSRAVPTDRPATASASTAAGAGAPAAPAVATSTPTGPDYRRLFRPVFQPAVLVWFGGLLWLLLALDYRRFWSLRTVDVLAVIFLAVAFEFRHDTRPVTSRAPEISYAFTAWTALFTICAYFFLRTLGQLLRRTTTKTPPPNIGAAAWVLLAFVVSTNFCTLPVADVGERGKRAALGGQYLRQTGNLPYGQTAFEAADGPLMYALHAALLKPASILRPAAGSPPVASDSSTAPDSDRAPGAALSNLAPARWISGAAHALLLLGIVILGRQYHSATTGAMLAGLYGILAPVAGEVAVAPMTVPGALVVWALLFASPKARTIGAALSGILLATAAGTMFYAGLLAPAWFGYFLRRRPAPPTIEEARPIRAASGSAVIDEDPAPRPRKPRDWGAPAFVAAFLLVAGAAKWYALHRTEPLPPRPDVCLAAVGRASVLGTHELSIRDGRWILLPTSGTTQSTALPSRCPVAPVMRWLADDGRPDAGPTLSAELLREVPADVWRRNQVAPPTELRPGGTHEVALRNIRPADPQAARALVVLYREAVGHYSWWQRRIAAGRTIFESVFAGETEAPLDAILSPSPAPTRPAAASGNPQWSAWSEWKRKEHDVLNGQDAGMAARTLARARIARMVDVRRYVFAGYLLLALVLLAVMVAFRSRCTVFHLGAASAALILAVQLWRADGGGADLPWYLPLTMLTLFAGRRRDALPPPNAAPPRIPEADSAVR